MDCSEEVAAIRRAAVYSPALAWQVLHGPDLRVSVDRIRAEQLRLSERDFPSAQFAWLQRPCLDKLLAQFPLRILTNSFTKGVEGLRVVQTAILVSLVISLTTTPIPASGWIRSAPSTSCGHGPQRSCR